MEELKKRLDIEIEKAEALCEEFRTSNLVLVAQNYLDGLLKCRELIREIEKEEQRDGTEK